MQTVKKGSKGEAVALLQLMLNEKGYACGSADGIFGTKTESAVKSYQKAKGLSADGIVGDNTYAKLLADSLLKNGSRGELVKQLQTRLNEQGYKQGRHGRRHLWAQYRTGGKGTAKRRGNHSGREGGTEYLDGAVGRKGSGRTGKRAFQAERVQVQGRNGSA